MPLLLQKHKTKQIWDSHLNLWFQELGFQEENIREQEIQTEVNRACIA